MNELARILALLSGAFLLRSVVVIVAATMLGRAVSGGALALKDAVLAAQANEQRLAQLEREYKATAFLVGTLQRELVEVWRREAAQRAAQEAVQPVGRAAP